MLKWLFETKEERAERKAKEREELFRRVREQEQLEEQEMEFAKKLVDYNKGNGLGFDCWTDTRIAKKWIKCQSDFTKPMLEIYTNNREFLDEHGSLFREIHLTKRQLDKYDSLKLLGLARLTEDRLEDINEKINTIKELYNSFSEEDKAKALNIELEVLNLIINDAEEKAKNMSIDYSNTFLNAETQRGIFKTQYMANILTDYKNAYGQALSCFNLRDITHIPELEQVENKIDFIKNHKEQLQEIVNKMAEVEELTNNTNLKATVRTPFGQIPQAYVDFQRKLVELKFEELVEEYGDIIKNEEYSQEWLSKIETVQSQLYDVLQTIKIEMTVLRNSGIIF